MTNNIGAISGGGNGYGVNWNNSSTSNENPEAAVNQEQQSQQPARQEVNPDDVMAFMAQNNNFVDLVKAPAPIEGVETDPTVGDRVAGYMENYEFIMGIIEEEFGPELAPYVMDMVMDRLMGMVD